MMREIKRAYDLVVDRSAYICESIMKYTVYAWDLFVDFSYEYKWTFVVATIVSSGTAIIL